MKVTIILCTYNGEKYINEQLNSILEQTYKNFEIIILDDNSTDNTLNIIKEYAKKYSFIKIIQNKQQLGVIKNFEKGIKLSSTEFIALCDQDDIWHKNKLEIELNAIKNILSPAMIHSDLEVVNENLNTIYTSFFKWKGYNFTKNKNLSNLISKSGVMGNTILFNKALKEKILPFFDKIPMHDYYIGVLNEIYGKRITINKPLIKYRLHSNNIGNKKKSFKEKLKSNLPYTDRKKFLKFLLEQNIPNTDKKIIQEFLEIIEYNSFFKLLKGLKKDYFKSSFFYKIKLIIRFFIFKVIK